MTFSRVMGDVDNYKANIGLLQPLYRGGRLASAIKIAKLFRDFTDFGKNIVRNELIFQVKKGFNTILFLQELIKIREASLKLLEEHLDVTRKKRKVEVVSDFEVLRAEVEVANAKPPLITAKNQLAIAKDSFRKLLGIGLSIPFELVGDLEPWERSREGLVESIGLARERRPEILQQKRLEEINQKVVDVEKGGYYPNLTLFANYEGILPNTEMELEKDWEWDWNAGIKLDIPIFSGFETKSRVSQAKIQLEKSKIQLRDLIERIELEVRSAAKEIQETEERILSQQKNIEKAREGLRIVELRYRHGVSPQIELLDAQVALTAARVNYFQAVYDHRLAVAKMERATAENLKQIELKRENDFKR